MFFGVLRTILRSGKRFLTVLTAISIVVCMMTSPAAAYGFSDVSRNDNSVVDYFDAINWASDNGYMVGTSSTTFSPNQYVSRATAICVIWRYAGRPAPSSSTNPFVDVSSSSWYYEAVLWGVAQGIIYGTSSTTFSPNATVTREQLMAFLYRYANLCYPNDVYFCNENELYDCLDANQIYYGLVTAMEWSISNGILVWPTSDYRLYPTASVQRKELALFVNRYSCNVDGLMLPERYAFYNMPIDFQSAQAGNDHYMITTTHKARLISRCYEHRLGINNYLQKDWSGSCYGMVCSCILDKTGQINFEKNFANFCVKMQAIPTLTSLTSPKHILSTDNQNSNTLTKAESAINYYQASQVVIHEYTEIIYRESSNGPFYGITNLVQSLKHCKPTVFSYTYHIGGGTYSHAVLIFGSPISLSYGFKYKIYDPSSGIGYLIINTVSNNLSIDFCEGNITSAEYIQDFYYFKSFDIDYDANNIG